MLTAPANHVVTLTSARLHYSCVYAIDAPSKSWALNKARRLWARHAPHYAKIGKAEVYTRAEHDAAMILADLEANARPRELYQAPRYL